MFSVQTQNQVLYYLTQLTSAVSPKCVSVPAKSKKTQECPKQSTEEVPRADHSEVLTDKINMYDVATTFKMKKNDVWLILDQLSMSTRKRHLALNSKWRVSYVSGSSFAENKRNFPCAQLTEPIILPVIQLNTRSQHSSLYGHSFKTPHGCHIQTRGIRIEPREKKRESQANTGVFKKFFFPQEKTQTSSISHEHREVDMEQIKRLFNTSHTSQEDLTKIKLAFVEGYEVGLNRQLNARNKRMKVMQVLGYISSVLLMLILCGLVYASGPYKFPSSQRSLISPETVSITFDDVKGVEEAKQELKDVVEFLKNPDKFTALGGKLPKGALLVGPPGTGKTLLARAVAGEAGVPFFQAAGPEFDEVLVGQGARRIRDLFKAAKERAPAVIFIDEIDSVGSMRTQSVFHPYANQTINQLLSEMDGFFQNEGVIVLGATNRRADLDKALMRPGRFDIEIYVNRPDFLGRKEILELYISKIMSQDIDIDYLARCTTGFTGADIESMINQAALKAAVNDEKYVTMKHIEYARDKVIMGPEGKLRGTDEEVNRITACHEAGHALVCFYTKNSTNIHKVTIIPRGQSLGHTAFLNEKDLHHVTRSQLMAIMDSMMGGRAAEELFFGADNVTTGAASDFQSATKIAEQMVKAFGMSEKVGFRSYMDVSNKEYITMNNDYSPNTNELIDLEVKRLLQESYERAKALLRLHVKEHKLLTDALLKYETLDGEDVKAILSGKKPPIELNGTHALIS